MAREIGATPLARLDYAAVVLDETFEATDRVTEPARAIVAARFPSARLIDNLLLPRPADARAEELSPPGPWATMDRPAAHQPGSAMLLTADVGNTETVLGVFDGPDLIQTWRLSSQPERSADEIALVFAGLLEHRGLSLEKLSGLCIASVVPDVTQQLREMAARYLSFEPLVVGPGTRTGVSVLTDNPREVGADRIVNTLAAYTRFGGPCDRRRLRHRDELRRRLGPG